MCKVFNKKINYFKLISIDRSKENCEQVFAWDKIKIWTNFIQFEFILKVLVKVIKDRPNYIFTRDIGVALILIFLRIKIIYEAHKEPKSKLVNFIFKFLSYKSNFILFTISDALKQYYLDNYNILKRRIFSYHDGVFIENYDKYRYLNKNRIRKSLNLPTDKVIMMHTGSLYPGRGAEYFGTIISSYPDILFVQVGGLEKDIEKYKSYYKKFNNIKFFGYQKNNILIQFQLISDILLFPMTKQTDTYWCCSPMKVFEYMATGVPIISSNIGSVAEVLNSSNSIPFNLKEKNSLILAVKLFFDDKESVKKKAKQGLKDVRTHYTWSKRVDQLLNFIQQ